MNWCLCDGKREDEIIDVSRMENKYFRFCIVIWCIFCCCCNAFPCCNIVHVAYMTRHSQSNNNKRNGFKKFTTPDSSHLSKFDIFSVTFIVIHSYADGKKQHNCCSCCCFYHLLTTSRHTHRKKKKLLLPIYYTLALTPSTFCREKKMYRQKKE